MGLFPAENSRDAECVVVTLENKSKDGDFAGITLGTGFETLTSFSVLNCNFCVFSFKYFRSIS